MKLKMGTKLPQKRNKNKIIGRLGKLFDGLSTINLHESE